MLFLWYSIKFISKSDCTRSAVVVFDSDISLSMYDTAVGGGWWGAGRYWMNILVLVREGLGCWLLLF